MGKDNIIGESIRKHRIKSRYTQKEIAELVDIESWSKISDIERGVYLPSVNNLIKLSKLLGFSLDELADNALLLHTTIFNSELSEKYNLISPDEQGIVRESANALMDSFISRRKYKDKLDQSHVLLYNVIRKYLNIKDY